MERSGAAATGFGLVWERHKNPAYCCWGVFQLPQLTDSSLSGASPVGFLSPMTTLVSPSVSNDSAPSVHLPQTSLASRCLARFFTTASVASSVSTSPFLQLLQLMFATHAALEGLVAACSISESLARCGIECHPSFPYHCGVGPSATKCHFDTRPNILAAFHHPDPSHHGGKYLTPSGTVVCVGVAPLSTTTECGSCSGADLSVFFHPTGCPACAAMPQLHSPTQRFLHIGEEALEPNGPDPRVSRLLTPDPIDSFLHPTRLHENGQIYDETKWLCQGLFGECAGADLTGHPGHTVVGIQTKPGGAPCLELYCTREAP